jgi:hypothetical protein
MTLNTARYVLLQDRMDWNRPQLSWIPKILYSSRLRRRATN